MKGKSTRTADPNSWKFINSGPTSMKTPGDLTRPSTCGRQLCNLVYVRGPGSRTEIYPWCMS